MADFGAFALQVAFFLVLYALVVDLLGAWRTDSGLLRSAANATFAGWLCLFAAIIVLLISLVQCDFSLEYVAKHTARALPLAYRLSALWAGAAGSLLLWLWLQMGITLLVFTRAKQGQRSFAAYARAASNLVAGFFIFVLIFDKNPFAVSEIVPHDGGGLNPLLQHPAMVLHPPTLFLGYAAYIIPFAWALAALATARPGERPEFFTKARNWMLLAWVFLTVGNALGAWWAYEELGWGGFWAWDPVENSSLMPWLTGLALLHAFKRFRARSATGRWVIFLSLLTFSLCVFGTFLTRYGLVSSVHAFPEPGLGIMFLVLLAVIWLLVAILGIRSSWRAKHDSPAIPVKGDGVVLLVNWLLVLLVTVILLGTIFPFLSGLFSSEKISLQPEYFTKITAPGGLLLLLLVGICPRFFRYGIDTSWRTIGGVIVAFAAVAAWFIFKAFAIPCFIISGYAVLNILFDFLIPRRSGSAKRRPLSWHGARVAHIGVVMCFISVAGAEGYSFDQEIAIRRGQSQVMAGRTITFEKLTTEKRANFSMTSAEISVAADGKTLTMSPGIALYHSGQRTSEVDIKRSAAGDLYIALTAIEQGGQLITLRVLIKPLINWLWVGSILMVLGALLTLLSWSRTKKANP